MPWGLFFVSLPMVTGIVHSRALAAYTAVG